MPLTELVSSIEFYRTKVKSDSILCVAIQAVMMFHSRQSINSELVILFSSHFLATCHKLDQPGEEPFF